MCKWGDDVNLLVPIPANCSHTGEFRWDVKPVDRCLAPYIQTLNIAGLLTAGCCCGHGKSDGYISFHDGTVFIIRHADPDEMSCVVLDQ